MKKINLLAVFVATIIIAMIFYSCSKESEVEPSKNTNLRTNFLGKKTYQEMKPTFDKLTFEEKVNLWENKINQLLTQNFPKEHLSLIKKLQMEFKKSNRNELNSLKETFIQLAKITPEKDFMDMFMDLKDYKFNGSFEVLKKQEELITYLNTSDYQYSKTVNYLSDSNAPPCNCNYSCSAQTVNPHVCYTSSCTPTTDGCGPFGLSSCDGRVYIC
jgi:hypothetical protein